MADEVQNNNGYKTAFKATSLFGGTQVLLILIKVAKSKLVAILLGTAGMGLMALFNTAVNLVSSISNLGLQSSAVKEIATANGQGDRTHFAAIVKAINRWVFATGAIGAIATIALSGVLSQLYFKTNEYILAFVFLSSVVLLNAMQQGFLAVLQGTRQLGNLVKANLYGALLAFAISIPFFYFFREDGIVWAIISTAVAYALVAYIFYRKTEIVKVSQTLKESFRVGLPAVKLGVAMAITGIVVSLMEFIIRTFMQRMGGIDDVGLYSSGWAINSQYLGLVFTAMAKDYYPRLSQICNDNSAIKEAVNQQGEIALLILTPMIMIMLVFVQLCVQILYSDEFLAAVPMVELLLIGSFIKSGSWGISFVFLAKGDSKAFLINEMGISLITLPSYLLGYYWGGLLGIGYAFVFNHSIYFIWVAIAAYKLYRLKYTRTYFRLFFVLLFAIVLFYALAHIFTLGYIIKTIVACGVSAYCLWELNRRVKLTSL